MALSCAAMAFTPRLGWRILSAGPRLSTDILQRFRGLASSNLADAMGRFGFMDPGIVARSGVPLSGPALTVVCRPADNLYVHKALQLAQPGDIVVVATGGNTTSAVFGELMAQAAVAARVGGLIVDGAVRDVAALGRLRFPVFSRVVCPGGCDKEGPGEINVPVSCGGAVVQPGDVVVGDSDGVVVVPHAEAETVLRLVAEIEVREKRRVAEIQGGALFRPDVDD